MAAGATRAHDTWLLPLPDTERGERALALGTGERFPRHETAIAIEALPQRACIGRGADPGRVWPLRWWADRPEALWLRTTRPVPAGELLDCRVQTQPSAIELAPTAVAGYLDEVRADAATRERWQGLQQQGRPWIERYRKNARWLAGGAGPDRQDGPIEAGAWPGDASPPLALDLRLQLPRWPLRAGDRVRAQLLLAGRPLPSHALELRSDASAIGLWRQTDGEGWVDLPLPLAARWLVRSIALRAAADGGWDSEFLSVGFEVLPAAAATSARER